MDRPRRGSGLEVVRAQIIDGVSRSGESLVALLAPGGYGKTVVAMQLCAALPASVFVDCSCVEPSYPRIVRALMANLASDGAREDPTQVLLPLSDEGSLSLDLQEALSARLPDDACVVLDDVPPTTPVEAFTELHRCIRGALPAARLIVTSRHSGLAVPILGDALVIGPAELRMSTAEVRTVFEAATGEAVGEGTLLKALEVSQGQAAAVRLLARSMCLRPAESVFGVPGGQTDYQEYLKTLAAQQLSRHHLRVLYAVSLLASGDSMEIAELFDERITRDLERISLCIPLVALEARDCGTNFVVHDLAIAAYTDAAFVGEYVDDRDALSCAVLRLLDQRRDYGRLFRVLFERNDPEQLLEWTELRGKALLDDGSYTLLSGVMRRLGPGRTLRSPRLLLLEAASLRERAEYKEALRKASVARSLAELDDDRAVLAEACMMMARLQMDMGRAGEAAESLERARSVGAGCCSSETVALIDAYLGLCCICVGDVAGAAEAAGRAAEAALDQRMANEVVGRITTSAAASIGVLSGRWDKTLDLCLRLKSSTMSRLP